MGREAVAVGLFVNIGHPPPDLARIAPDVPTEHPGQVRRPRAALTCAVRSVEHVTDGSVPSRDERGIMERLVAIETLIVLLLLAASVVAVVVRRLRVPYTVSLVVAGLLITSASPLRLELTSELIMAVFV